MNNIAALEKAQVDDVHLDMDDGADMQIKNQEKAAEVAGDDVAKMDDDMTELQAAHDNADALRGITSAAISHAHIYSSIVVGAMDVIVVVAVVVVVVVIVIVIVVVVVGYRGTNVGYIGTNVGYLDHLKVAYVLRRLPRPPQGSRRFTSGGAARRGRRRAARHGRGQLRAPLELLRARAPQCRRRVGTALLASPYYDRDM